MADLPDAKAVRGWPQRAGPWLLWLLALGLIIGAIVLSHRWNDRAGIDAIYVVLALIVIAVPLPPVRQFLGEATNVEVAGVKVTRQIAQDATDVTDDLPLLDFAFEQEGTTTSVGELRVIGKVWPKDFNTSLGLLQSTLGERVHWAINEIYGDAWLDPTDTAAGLERLRDNKLLTAQEARIALAIIELGKRTLSPGKSLSEKLSLFMPAADRIVHTFRYVVLDKQVRTQLSAPSMKLKLIDFAQPDGPWPDFYAYTRRRESVLRISVTMARTEQSTMIRDARERLRRQRVDTPLDGSAQPLIAVPRTSLTKFRSSSAFPAVRRSALERFVVNWKEANPPRPG
jgi:hypothetical protein